MSELSIEQIAAKLLENETSEEVLEIKKQILKRIATESDVKPSRIPAPLNISEIGGYFNLMEKLQVNKMQQQTLISILGLPVQQDTDNELIQSQTQITLLKKEIEKLKKDLESLKQG